MLIGGFNIDQSKRLGFGKYGDTYFGTDKDGTKIAAKQVYHKSNHGKKYDANSLKKKITRDEIKSNQHLLTYLDYTLKNDETSWIVMEYCEQGNLADYQNLNTKLTTSDQIDLMTQCAEGIAFLHSCGIIHREIKPQNILLKRKGERDIIQIADFYSATMFESDNLSSLIPSAKSESNKDWTDEDYFKPPEALKKIGNSAKITEYYDIFQLGLIYYAMINGCTVLKPVVKGNDSPIGHVISEKHSKGWKFDIEVINKISGLKKVIDDMIVLYPSERSSSSNVLKQLKALQQGEHERNAKEPKEKDISSYLHKKFHQFLLESGPCEPTCDKILDKVYELQKEEFKTIMVKGSIKDFLLEFDDIVWKDDKLQAVEKNTEEEKILDRCDEEKYKQFKTKIESDDEIEPFIQGTYTSLDGATIYVSTEKENIETVTNHLEKYYTEFTNFTECFSPNNFKWLMTNEGTNILVDNCIGPGSFILKDKDLTFFKKYCANKTQIVYPLQSIMFDLDKWGSIGCFARNRDDPTKIYALSAKHIVDNIIGYDEDHNLDMVSGFQQEHKVTAKHHANIVKEELNVKAKDLVHLTKGYHGILGGMDKSNVMVDVALFGPLSKTMTRNHESYPIEPRKKITVFPSKGSDIVGKRVMKYGAKTGYTSGIIIAENKECHVPQREREFMGTFVVTTTNEEGQIDQNGTFARQGDSGSIVLLEDNSGSLRGVGIIHSKLSVFLYECNIINNVIYCVGLDNCIKALEQQLMIHLDLYYHNFTPKLCVEGPEAIENENMDIHVPGNTDTPATSLAQVTADCVLCCVKKKVVEKMPKKKYKTI